MRNSSRKRKQTRIVSLLLILLIILVIAAGTVALLYITGTHPNSDPSAPESILDSSDTALVPEESFESESTSEPESTESLVPDATDSSSEPENAENDDASVAPEPVPTITVEIPERSTFPEIAEILADVSGTTVDTIYEQADALTATLPNPESADACYFPLEGYIIAGSYELPEEQPLLENLLAVSLERLAAVTASEDYTLHEILSMASIVEIEASRGGLSDQNTEEMPHIAEVIYNRLGISMKLQMDVTFQYGYNTLQPQGASEQVLALYNTYDTPALPLGPICSPSMDAVEAVMNPVPSENLFFVFDEEGTYYYAADYEQHLDNCVLAGIR